jgi:diguanylate cyclase (GGDEF)-like protein
MFGGDFADITRMGYRRTRRRVTPAAAVSFKLKLVSYFCLLSLLPAAAVFWGFSAVVHESEQRRVEARLQGALRVAISGFDEELAEATRAATTLAGDPRFQSALANGDSGTVRRMLRLNANVRVESPRFAVGARPPLAAEREIVVGGRQALGSVFASVALDGRLVARLERRAGLARGERVVVVGDERLVVGPGPQRAIHAVPGRTAKVRIGDRDYRLLLAPGGTGGATLGVAAPEAAIDAASGALRRRLALGLLATLLLIAVVAYLEGLSPVRSVTRVARAANAIARGRLDERVAVSGRDELATLGDAFNQMADQLQARVEELEAERTRLREAFARFGTALAATHHPEQLLRVIVETAVEATGADGGTIVGADGSVIETGRASDGERLEIPLQASHTSFGTLFLVGSQFDEDASLTAISLAGQSVLALENARLHRIAASQARIDELTGLANRRHADEALARELARAARFGDSTSVVLADLDDFKSINDLHGHPAGDGVLKQFARVLVTTVRDIDVVARWGGEEFLLILPGTDAEGAARLAERIRAELERTTVLTPDAVPLVVTASFGVVQANDGASAAAVVSAADAALYAAKRAGKNRVERAGESVARL